MFALEVSFKDSSVLGTLMFIRRPQALIGATNFANVILDDMKGLPYQIRLVRSLGRSFKLFLLASDSGDQQNIEGSQNASDSWPKWIEGTYSGIKQLDLGKLKLSVAALDSDLILKEGEALDKAGFRVLRQAVKTQSPVYPAVAFGNPEVVVSFNLDSPILLGRGRDCPLRIESPDVSSRHARIGSDANSFWIEDLGSTNGTFIAGERVTARRSLKAGEQILIARQIPLTIITSQVPEKQIAEAQTPVKISKIKKYPCLISLSELVKPRRMPLDLGKTMNVGRDPSSDMWIGAPHVSRQHLQVKATNEKLVSITDVSTNGTEYDCGKLSRNTPLKTEGSAHVFDFGYGITLGLIFNEEQEKVFSKSSGAIAAFGGQFAKAMEQDQMQAMGQQVKLSDVSQLVGRRGRKATAHQMKAIFQSTRKSTKFIIFGFLILFSILIGILVILFGASFL